MRANCLISSAGLRSQNPRNSPAISVVLLSQTLQVFQNIKEVLKAAGLDLSNIVFIALNLTTFYEIIKLG
ncbi:MAG: hypothetical protein GY864_03050 [Desulfobacterales bacterium]|nr:hypothetical protein [Desulfobacterales bacterium]